jgi:hypothetical protein
MIVPTELLKSIVDEIISIDRTNIVIISGVIFSASNLDFKLSTTTDFTIDRFNVHQNFSENIVDDINLDILTSANSLIKLVENKSSLYISLVVEYVDPETGQVVLDEEVEIYKYKVFVHNIENILKRLPADAVIPNDGIDNPITETQAINNVSIKLQLFSDSSYFVNKSSFVGLLSDADVSSAIKYISSACGISNIDMISPDNTVSYKHIYIPPEQWKFKSIIGFLQKEYGIYNCGLNYYFTNDILYVYPPFDMDSTHRPDVSIYKIHNTTYAGSPNFHKVKDDELHIVSNSEMVNDNLSARAAENSGNSRVFLRSDNMIDGIVDQSSMKITDTSIALSNKLDNSIHPESAIPQYRKPSQNVFELASQMNEGNTELIGLGWASARLFMIKPGTPVSFIYDEKNVVMKKHGIIEMVGYEVVKSGNSFGQFVYQNVCTMIIRLELDQKKFTI